MKDVDDTIKISEVLKESALLRNTFITQPPEPVTRMPALYKLLQDKLDHPTFFYLSASPWQLYEFNHEFVRNNYPPGQIIMREMTTLHFRSLFNSWWTSPQDFKVDRMEKIHGWFPQRKFICIGDSTQRDPEAYAQM